MQLFVLLPLSTFTNNIFTAYFHPNWSLRTAGVRGTHAINGCRHFWEIQVNHRLFGTRYVTPPTSF